MGIELSLFSVRAICLFLFAQMNADFDVRFYEVASGMKPDLYGSRLGLF